MPGGLILVEQPDCYTCQGYKAAQQNNCIHVPLNLLGFFELFGAQSFVLNKVLKFFTLASNSSLKSIMTVF